MNGLQLVTLKSMGTANDLDDILQSNYLGTLLIELL